MEKDHGTVWGSIQVALELYYMEVDGYLVSNFKYQVANIESFINKTEYSVFYFINIMRELTKGFIQLRQRIEALDNLQIERDKKDYESSLGRYNWIVWNMDRGGH